jgi:hypothetical protein
MQFRQLYTCDRKSVFESVSERCKQTGQSKDESRQLKVIEHGAVNSEGVVRAFPLKTNIGERGGG